MSKFKDIPKGTEIYSVTYRGTLLAWYYIDNETVKDSHEMLYKVNIRDFHLTKAQACAGALKRQREIVQHAWKLWSDEVDVLDKIRKLGLGIPIRPDSILIDDIQLDEDKDVVKIQDLILKQGLGSAINEQI